MGIEQTARLEIIQVKLTDHTKTAFQAWINTHGLTQGTTSVEFAHLLNRFSTDIQLPVTPNLFGRLMSPLFLKRVDAKDRKTYYLLNKLV